MRLAGASVTDTLGYSRIEFILNAFERIALTAKRSTVQLPHHFALSIQNTPRAHRRAALAMQPSL